MDAPSREIPDIWVRTRRRGLFGLAVVAAAAVAAWAGRGTSRVVRPFEFEEDDEHVFGLANASSSRLGNATVSGLRDDDTDVDGLCLDYCPNTTSANDAACRLCDLQKVVRFHNGYEDASGIPIGEGYYPYMYLVEMWKPTTAELNAFELGDEAVSRVRRVDWSGDDVGHAVGSRVTMIFETHGTRNVTVSMRVATTRGEELGFHVELAVDGALDLVTAGTPALLPSLAHAGLRDSGRHRVSAGTVVLSDTRAEAQCPLGLRPAAVVASRVVSTPLPRQFTLDAGVKALAADAGHPMCAVLGHEGFEPLIPSEEHLPVAVREPSDRPTKGDVFYLVPKHVCPTVNLAESALLVEENGAFSELPIEARAHPLFLDEGPVERAARVAA